jgi:Kef-type K+ transport system membrane component KefB
VEISKLFGLPAHPLIVHLPVVLIPIAAIGAVLMVLSRSWRTRIGWLVVAAAGVSLVLVQLAIGSGEALEESVDRSDLVQTHAHLGEDTLPYVAVFFVAVLAFMVADRWRLRGAAGDAATVARRGAWGDPLMAMIAVAVLATSVLSGVWIYRAGHSGATSVWSDVQVGGEGDNSGHGGGGGSGD